MDEESKTSPTVEGEPKRRRQSNGDSDNSEHQTKRARLTRENLARFNRMGKQGIKASVPSDSTAESSKTKTTSTTTPGFALQARNNGILHALSSRPPTNLANIREQHDRSRATPPPSESMFELYSKKVGVASNEATMVFEVGRHLLKEHDDTRYHRAFNQAFTGIPKDVGFNNGLSAPQPDFVEGLELEEFRPLPVSAEISGIVLYKDDLFSVTLPHIAGEWKGRGKDMEEARLQSAYDGAALVYARNQALSCLGKPDPPGHAAVTTFTTDGRDLNFFAHYAVESEDGTLEYHQYPIASTTMLSSFDDFKKGRCGLRNHQDRAREQSYALKDELKGHWKQIQQHLNTLRPSAEGAPPASLQFSAEQPDAARGQPAHQPTPPTDSASHKRKAPSSPESLPASSSASQKRRAPSSRASSYGSGGQAGKLAGPCCEPASDAGGDCMPLKGG